MTNPSQIIKKPNWKRIFWQSNLNWLKRVLTKLWTPSVSSMFLLPKFRITMWLLCWKFSINLRSKEILKEPAKRKVRVILFHITSLFWQELLLSNFRRTISWFWVISQKQASTWISSILQGQQRTFSIK
jgi:hypothetical protein